MSLQREKKSQSFKFDHKFLNRNKTPLQRLQLVKSRTINWHSW